MLKLSNDAKTKTQTLELEMRPELEFRDYLCTLKIQNGKTTGPSKLMLLRVHRCCSMWKSCLEVQHKQLNQATSVTCLVDMHGLQKQDNTINWYF